jgi:hypothetical protein
MRRSPVADRLAVMISWYLEQGRLDRKIVSEAAAVLYRD